jgi:hypothetical protein
LYTISVARWNSHGPILSCLGHKSFLCPGRSLCLCYSHNPHFVSISVIRSTLTILQCLCSIQPYLTAWSYFCVIHLTPYHHIGIVLPHIITRKKGEKSTLKYFERERPHSTTFIIVYCYHQLLLIFYCCNHIN